jgi:hypothetical protein
MHHPARPRPDLPAVVEPYNAGIIEQVATFQTCLRSVADIAEMDVATSVVTVAAFCAASGRPGSRARRGSLAKRCDSLLPDGADRRAEHDRGADQHKPRQQREDDADCSVGLAVIDDLRGEEQR